MSDRDLDMLRSRRFAESDTHSAHGHFEHTVGAQGIPVERAVPHERLGVAIDSNSPAGNLAVARRGHDPRRGTRAKPGVKAEQVGNGEGGSGRSGRVGGKGLLCGSYVLRQGDVC